MADKIGLGQASTLLGNYITAVGYAEYHQLDFDRRNEIWLAIGNLTERKYKWLLYLFYDKQTERFVKEVNAVLIFNN